MEQMNQEICVVTKAPVAAASNWFDLPFLLPFYFRNNMDPTSSSRRTHIFSSSPNVQTAPPPSADVLSYLDQHGSYCEAIRYFIELGLPPTNPHGRKDIIFWCFKHNAKEALLELFRLTGNAELDVPPAREEEVEQTIVLVKALLEENAVTGLRFSHPIRGLDEGMAQLLASGLRKNASLTSLKMDCLALSEAAARIILGAISANSNLKEFESLGSCSDDALAQDIAAILKTSKLTKFHLEGGMSTEALCTIIQGAKESETLRSILLCSVKAPSTTSPHKEQLGIHIVELLARNPELNEVGLPLSKMSLDEFSTVMTAIKDGGHIKHLTLMYGDFTKEHLKAICPLLTKNAVLTTLDLSRWWPDDEGLQMLADGLKDNKHLLEMKLHRRTHEVYSTGPKRIQTQLQENKARHWARMHGGIFDNAPSQKWLPIEMGTQVLQELCIAEQRLRGPRMTSEDLRPLLEQIQMAVAASAEIIPASSASSAEKN